MYRNIFISVLFLLMSSWLYGEEIRWNISPNPCVVGDSLEISLEVVGELKSEIEAPNFKELSFQGQSQSTQVSIINGSFSKTNSYIFTYLCEEEGELTLPPKEFEFKSGNRKISSEQKIKILKSNSGVNSGKGSSQSQDSASSELQLSLERRLSSQQVYVGQVLKSSLVLLHNYPVRNLEIKDSQVPGMVIKRENDPDKMAIKSVQDSQTGSKGIEIPEIIFFDKSGKIEIPSSQILLQAQTPSRGIKKQRRSMLDEFFGDDAFFGGGLAQRFIRKSLKSEPISIQVLELPKENKPSNFTGAVGDYEFSLADQVSKNISQGGSLSLKFLIKGKGDLTGIKLPRFLESEDYQVFYEEPEIKSAIEEDGEYRSSVQFTVVVVFQKAGNISLGSLEFNFFNPETKKYVERTLGPFDFEVAEDKNFSNKDDASSAKSNDPPKSDSVTSEQVVAPLNKDRKSSSFILWLVLGGGVFLLLILALLFFRKRFKREKTVSPDKAEVFVKTFNSESKVWKESETLQSLVGFMKDLKNLERKDPNFAYNITCMENLTKSLLLKQDPKEVMAKTWSEIQHSIREDISKSTIVDELKAIYEDYFFGSRILDSDLLLHTLEKLLENLKEGKSIVGG